MLESQNKRTILEIEKGSTEGNFRSSNATAWMLKIPKKDSAIPAIDPGSLDRGVPATTSINNTIESPLAMDCPRAAAPRLPLKWFLK